VFLERNVGVIMGDKINEWKEVRGESRSYISSVVVFGARVVRTEWFKTDKRYVVKIGVGLRR